MTNYLNIGTLWARVVQTYSPYQIEVFGTILVQIVFFWLPCAVYIALPYVFPAFSERHKLQPAPKQPTAKEIRHCALLVLRNQLISIGLTVANTHLATRAGKASPFRVTASPPALREVAVDVAACVLLREAMFYYAHRLLHTRRLYRAVHKTHHRFTAPVALAAQYAHPVEHVVANALPVALPPALLSACRRAAAAAPVHVLTAWAFVAVVLLDTTTVHSGFDFFAGAASHHDAHHEKFNVHFGVIGLLDWLHGTGDRKLRTMKEE